MASRSLKISVAAAALSAALLAVAPFPPGSILLNTLGCLFAKRGLGQVAAPVFRYLAHWGDLAATNNLGVLYMRGIGLEPDPAKATELLEAAIRQGQPQAAYNRALMLLGEAAPSSDEMTRTYALLSSGMYRGDPHATVVLARNLLRFPQAAARPDADAWQLALMKRAAATGDADYRLLYIDTLLAQAERLSDPALARRAQQLLLAAHRKGDAEATLMVSRLRDAPIVRHNDAQVGAILAVDRRGWLALAAEQGSASAACDLGLELYAAHVAAPDQARAGTATGLLEDCLKPDARRAGTGLLGRSSLYAEKLTLPRPDTEATRKAAAASLDALKASLPAATSRAPLAPPEGRAGRPAGERG